MDRRENYEKLLEDLERGQRLDDYNLRQILIELLRNLIDFEKVWERV